MAVLEASTAKSKNTGKKVTLEQFLLSASEVLFPHRKPRAIDVNAKASDGDTPLHVAAIRGDREAVRLLVEAGAQIDALGDMSCTPLYNAVGHGHHQVARLLLEFGADPNLMNELESSAMAWAKDKGNMKMLRILKKTRPNPVLVGAIQALRQSKGYGFGGRLPSSLSAKAANAASCRLQILLARKASVGVIFRRGPTRWVQLILWDTKNDKFSPGQWFHGHIYVGRSDLSPDGSLLIYFANKFNRKTVSPDSEYTYAWTAISKPPYLTALALWPKGDCWHGGGLFEGRKQVFLNHRPESANPHPKHLPKGVRVRPNPEAYGEDDPVVIPRMERDGWKFVQSLDYDYYAKRTKQPVIFEKPFLKGKFTLRIETYYEPHQQLLCYLADRKGRQMEIGLGSWADIDQQGRLVFSSGGKLFEGVIQDNHVKLNQLADFSQSKPASLESPAWARHW
jgi:hypothetical protein